MRNFAFSRGRDLGFSRTRNADWPSSFLQDPWVGALSPLVDLFPEIGNEDRKWSPRVDIYEEKNEIHIDAELPGMTKDNIKLKMKDGFLILQGDRQFEKKGRKW